MKTPRKLTSLLLALLLVFALAATAAADNTGTTTKGTITVDNPIKGQTYTAYKIFDVVYDEPTATGHYSYTIEQSSPWFETVKSYTTGLNLTQVNGTNTYIVEKLDGFSAPSFAETLKAAAADKTDGKKLTVENGSASVGNLDLGYYFVTSNTDALCNLTTTAPNATIHDKNDVPFNKEGVQKRDVEVGKVLDYKITGKVPDYTGFETYTYEITDTMSQGLTFNDDVQVKVGDVPQTASDRTYAFQKGTGADDYTFKVTIYVKNYTPGQSIEVKYTATVNEKAVAEVSENKAVLIYSNKPGTNETGKIEPESHKVYSAQIEIYKFWEKDGTKNNLPGVGFKLYKEEPTTGTDTVKKYYKLDETNNAVSWVVDETDATQVTTSPEGKAYFKGLANGTYHLVETKTPDGFNPLTAPVDVEVKGKADDKTSLTVTKEIENKTGAVLPSTGGMGTTVFYVLGAVLVVGAGVLLVTKKRMSRNEG